jgi:hypothetical protein
MPAGDDDRLLLWTNLTLLGFDWSGLLAELGITSDAQNEVSVSLGEDAERFRSLVQHVAAKCANSMATAHRVMESTCHFLFVTLDPQAAKEVRMATWQWLTLRRSGSMAVGRFSIARRTRESFASRS